MCGIVGIVGQHHVAEELVYALHMLQHRGQDAAGILTLTDHFHLQKKRGLVAQVFNDQDIAALPGTIGIGHVRYATQGTHTDQDAQPFYLSFPQAMGLIHNGNITNATALRNYFMDRGYHFLSSTNDAELLLGLMMEEFAESPRQTMTPDLIFRAIEKTQTMAEGAYAVIGILGNGGLLAFQDPHAIRPLLIGKRQNPKMSSTPTYALASESTCLEVLGFEVMGELGPREAVYITHAGEIHWYKPQPADQKKRRFCVFEYIYFAREDTRFWNRSVMQLRTAMGQALAKHFKQRDLHPDIVIDVPSSAWFFATALARELGIPYEKGLLKNKYIGRSFILASQSMRDAAVRLKLHVLPDAVRGKKVAVVDDSLVRGTTARRIIRQLRQAGAAAVYFVSAAPPVRYPCVYGIDMADRAELIAAQNNHKMLCEELGADALIFQDLSDLKSVMQDDQFCFACFEGIYPTQIDTAKIAAVGYDRRHARQINPETRRE